MANYTAEAATIRSFVVANRQERLLELLGNQRRRREACDALNHFAYWDERFMQVVDSTEDVLELLRRCGAPATCHVIADAQELDGREMPLADAVEACEEHSFASVLCCIPGELGFYFDEVAAPRRRLLLRRAGAAGSR